MHNSLIIDSIAKKYEKLGLLDKVEMINRISPVAWQNVNLVGKYELKKGSGAKNYKQPKEYSNSSKDPIKKLVFYLNKPEKWTQGYQRVYEYNYTIIAALFCFEMGPALF